MMNSHSAEAMASVLRSIPFQVSFADGIDETVEGVDHGREPACVETCPTKARIFGLLDGGDQPLNAVISRKNAFTLLPEQGTSPNVFYF